MVLLWTLELIPLWILEMTKVDSKVKLTEILNSEINGDTKGDINGILEVILTLKVIRIKIEIGCLVMSNYVDIM